MTTFRGGLASLIFRKALDLHPNVISDSAPVTLMSTDVDGAVLCLQMLHDLWISAIEVPVGMYLLYRQVGVSCFFLLITGMSVYSHRVQWNT
jgi:ATP-binding cassette, subfamily C (CFTR/MRP), member 1